MKPRTTIRLFLVGCCAVAAATGAAAQPLSPAERRTLAGEIEQSFTRQLLDRFFPRVIDQPLGGFRTSFSRDWQPTGPQDKMIVSQARHTWLPAKTRQLYPNRPHLAAAARHGFAFLGGAMWDRTHGGFRTWVTRAGKPLAADHSKTAYGNAFGIYALAAYYQTFGDTAALELAKRTFRWLETHSHDPVHRGYYQNLEPDGTPAERGADGKINPELRYKDQNSSIHLLEAFAELYRVWPDPLLGERLAEMLVLIRDTIVTERGNLTLFLTPDWQPVSYRDSTEAARKAHYSVDHVSPGHDIETAYLLLEASHALDSVPDARTVAIAKRMVDHTLRTGWDETVGGFYERGYYLRGNDRITLLDDRKNWWAQAEGLNTLLLMADTYPNDAMRYGEKFRKQWHYVQRYLIDSTYGGWYAGGLDKEPASQTGPKGHAWKAAYHEGRSLMNCLQRLRPDTVAPSLPTQLTLSQDRTALRWKAARDDRHVVGYDVYRNGTRIGYTPLTFFPLPVAKPAPGTTFRVIARDAAGNPSPAAQLVPVE
ncbi:MAG: AGE family epimerase/isomerase [Ferruginibacter sp.]|nr:AGE family epimerase/isomerase [Cytophagales bacterium]